MSENNTTDSVIVSLGESFYENFSKIVITTGNNLLTNKQL